MDLSLLPAFVAVAEAASISAAARRLGLPKSSVSRAVTALEEALGVQLVHRTTRKVSLTTAGAAFLARTRPHLASIEAAAAAVAEQGETPSGVLRLTASEDVGMTVLAPAVERFAARHPSIVLDVRLSNERLDLVAQGFDAALRIAGRALPDSALVARSLGAFEVHLFASPDYVARHGAPKTVEEAAARDWIALTGMRTPRPFVLPKTPRLVTNDVLFVREAVRAGLGIGLLPTFLARNDLTAGRLVRIVPRAALRGGRLLFVHPPAEHVPRKLTAFRDFLLEYLRERPLG